eukprot:7931861-Alexandrium_andersonii.AAC.1
MLRIMARLCKRQADPLARRRPAQALATSAETKVEGPEDLRRFQATLPFCGPAGVAQAIVGHFFEVQWGVGLPNLVSWVELTVDFMTHVKCDALFADIYQRCHPTRPSL